MANGTALASNSSAAVCYTTSSNPANEANLAPFIVPLCAILVIFVSPFLPLPLPSLMLGHLTSFTAASDDGILPPPPPIHNKAPPAHRRSIYGTRQTKKRG